jgi:hypothetical protein
VNCFTLSAASTPVAGGGKAGVLRRLHRHRRRRELRDRPGSCRATSGRRLESFGFERLHCLRPTQKFDQGFGGGGRFAFGSNRDGKHPSVGKLARKGADQLRPEAGTISDPCATFSDDLGGLGGRH